MHILVVNDDGPPSAISSPYIHSFVNALQQAGHIVSVVLPHAQRSWIGKAHMIGQNVVPSYYCPGPLNEFKGTTLSCPPPYSRKSSPGQDDSDRIVLEVDVGEKGSKKQENVEEGYILLNSTPATCVQIGLYHYFQHKPHVDLVISGPNYGRNVTAVFSLSSGTLGAALEAASCSKRAVALSYAFFRKEGEELGTHDWSIVDEANRLSIKLIEWLCKHWDDEQEGKADLYSVNVPLIKGMSGNKVFWTNILENRWEAQSCFEEVVGEEASVEEAEEEIREAEGKVEEVAERMTGSGVPNQQQKHFKWMPRFQDVYRSVERSGEGNDGKTIMNHNISVTPLKANFMHALKKTGEINLRAIASNGMKVERNLQEGSTENMALLTNETKSSQRLYLYVEYEDAYVQPLIIEAIQHKFPPGSYTLMSSVTELPLLTSAYLHIGAYESLPFEQILSHPATSWTNAYIIRKALIRKHYLSNTVELWTAKHPHSILATNVKPSCSFEVDYAEFLEDALSEAWELKASFEANEGKPASERIWWILKPGMSDRGQGIRLFSTEEELQAVFEQWEADSPDSDDELAGEDDTACSNSDEESKRPEGVTKDYIITSHLRHFLAQPYVHPPLLLPHDSRKFHIRTYVLALGALKIYVYKPMLALFAMKPYVPPWSSISAGTAIDLAPHLTNTCLRSSSSPSASASSPSVYLLNSLPLPPNTSLQAIQSQIFALTAEIFEAAARAQGIHFQPLPNAFEVFGLDFLVDAAGTVWLLECNAFPDFGQTGEELRGVVAGFWEAVVGVLGVWWDLHKKGTREEDVETRQVDGDGELGEELVLVREVDLGRR